MCRIIIFVIFRKLKYYKQIVLILQMEEVEAIFVGCYFKIIIFIYLIIYVLLY